MVRGRPILTRTFGLYIRYFFQWIKLITLIGIILFFFLDYFSLYRKSIYSNFIAYFNLNLKAVLVEGRKNIPVKDWEFMRDKQGAEIFSLNLKDIEKQVSSNEWVSRCSVRRILPDSLSVYIIERNPIAIWQDNYKQHVIDQNGRIFKIKDLEQKFAHLLHVVGKGANLHANQLISYLSTNSSLADKVSVAIFYGERRWDLILGDIVVKMPEYNFQKAWRYLGEIDNNRQLFEQSIKVLDLRNEGKCYLEKHVQ